jgi:hypothetical protein
LGQGRKARRDLHLHINGAGFDAFKGHGGDVLNHPGHLAKPVAKTSYQGKLVELYPFGGSTQEH